MFGGRDNRKRLVGFVIEEVHGGHESRGHGEGLVFGEVEGECEGDAGEYAEADGVVGYLRDMKEDDSNS